MILDRVQDQKRHESRSSTRSRHDLDTISILCMLTCMVLWYTHCIPHCIQSQQHSYNTPNNHIILFCPDNCTNKNATLILRRDPPALKSACADIRLRRDPPAPKSACAEIRLRQAAQRRQIQTARLFVRQVVEKRCAKSIPFVQELNFQPLSCSGLM